MIDTDPDSGDITRKQQTFFLSTEFLVTMVAQSAVFLVLGTTVINRVEARVAALESQQVTGERIARIEEKMAAMLYNQQELKTNQEQVSAAIQSVQVELKSQRR